ncbi:Hypothetical_protein [Hexamita inflata]|uniref:Hypothetical_protein n=1 Tax=Hexamita inflata TaxID=28002 RepID=A0AA86U3L1_9EUKA|nr:Hypothetical protein HINF_LOCUS17343 [Hexamita inflata]
MNQQLYSQFFDNMDQLVGIDQVVPTHYKCMDQGPQQNRMYLHDCARLSGLSDFVYLSDSVITVTLFSQNMHYVYPYSGLYMSQYPNTYTILNNKLTYVAMDRIQRQFNKLVNFVNEATQNISLVIADSPCYFLPLLVTIFSSQISFRRVVEYSSLPKQVPLSQNPFSITIFDLQLHQAHFKQGLLTFTRFPPAFCIQLLYQQLKVQVTAEQQEYLSQALMDVNEVPVSVLLCDETHWVAFVRWIGSVLFAG